MFAGSYKQYYVNGFGGIIRVFISFKPQNKTTLLESLGGGWMSSWKVDSMSSMLIG